MVGFCFFFWLGCFVLLIKLLPLMLSKKKKSFQAMFLPSRKHHCAATLVVEENLPVKKFTFSKQKSSFHFVTNAVIFILEKIHSQNEAIKTAGGPARRR